MVLGLIGSAGQTGEGMQSVLFNKFNLYLTSCSDFNSNAVVQILTNKRIFLREQSL